MENWKHTKGKAAGAFGDVPEGYFESLKNEVMQQLEHPKPKTVVKQSWVFARVAAVLLLIMASAALMVLVFTPKRNLEMSQRSKAENRNRPIVDDTGKRAEKPVVFVQPIINDTLGWDDIPTDELIEYLLQWEIDEI